MIDIPSILWRLVNHIETTELSQAGWSAGFHALCDKLAREYPFTFWKGIDWESLRERFEPEIQAAESTGDVRAYYLVLRQFLHAIPDAQIELWGDDWGLRNFNVGGGYGLALVGLDDGCVLANKVIADGPADLAGLRSGARILAWNDQSIEDALEQTLTLWAERPAATHAMQRLEQLRFLTRAPIGTAARITFHNPGAPISETALLTASDDKHELLNRMMLLPGSVPGGAILSRRLPSGIGYISVNALAASAADRMYPYSSYRTFRNAMRGFIRDKAVGIVVDLRRCEGGEHRLAAMLSGFFHPRPLFYAATATFDPGTETFEIRKPSTQTLMQVVPQDVYFEGPVAALIGPRTSGAAEGFARAIQRASRGTVVGFGASGGMFGYSPSRVSEVRMPLGYVVSFPSGRSLNQDGVIQIESNRYGEGGVTPNIRVPLNDETFNAVFIEARDVELTYAVYELTNAARRMATRQIPAESGRSVPATATTRQILAFSPGQA